METQSWLLTQQELESCLLLVSPVMLHTSCAFSMAAWPPSSAPRPKKAMDVIGSNVFCFLPTPPNCLPGGSFRSPRLRAHSHKTSPPSPHHIQVPIARSQAVTLYSQPHAGHVQCCCTIRTDGLCRVISHQDLWEGFCPWMSLGEKFRSKTPFLVPTRVFDLNVLPFELRNAPVSSDAFLIVC